MKLIASRTANLVIVTLTILLGLLFTASGMASAQGATVPDNKVDVCKYVGTPGLNERLQTGQNPIEVSVNSIKNAPHDPPQVGDYFADAQGRSLVIAVAGDPEASIADCPGYVPPIDPPTATVTITAPPVTVTASPVTSTVTVTDPAITDTVTVPPVTVTDTATQTVTEPPITDTVTNIVTSTAPAVTQTDTVTVPVTVTTSGTSISTKTGTPIGTTVGKPAVHPPRSSTPLASTGISAGKQILIGLALLVLGATLAFGPGVKRRMSGSHQH